MEPESGRNWPIQHRFRSEVPGTEKPPAAISRRRSWSSSKSPPTSRIPVTPFAASKGQVVNPGLRRIRKQSSEVGGLWKSPAEITPPQCLNLSESRSNRRWRAGRKSSKRVHDGEANINTQAHWYLVDSIANSLRYHGVFSRVGTTPAWTRTL